MTISNVVLSMVPSMMPHQPDMPSVDCEQHSRVHLVSVARSGTLSLSDLISADSDRRRSPFVSVTQQFNTTTSMGRLTLNVLLSFAQFEREVTSERIRDKIAASKQKGMWMGGGVPLGYDAVNRKLRINAEEAKTVRLLFGFYLKLCSVRKLQEECQRLGLRTKLRTLLDGRQSGGTAFSRGHL
jgi:DNA invertase Pin-like site-specific DNA recombinase